MKIAHMDLSDWSLTIYQKKKKKFDLLQNIRAQAEQFNINPILEKCSVQSKAEINWLQVRGYI